MPRCLWLIARLAAVNPRTAVVLINGSPMELGGWIDKVPAIVEAWYPGMPFANEARDLLADGWNVEMGNFGFFSTSLQCPPVKDKKEIRAASVQMKNINFRASRPFKKEVGDKMRLQRGESITRPKKNSISRETCRDRLNTYLENHLFISRTDYSHLTGRNKKVAIEELNSFITDGIIGKEGVGKLTVYIKV